MAALLKVKGMTHFFGGLRAVNDFNLNIEQGQICGLIGPNGAGKTTVFNLITGVFTPTEGIIELEGKNIKGVETHRIAASECTFPCQTACPRRIRRDQNACRRDRTAPSAG